MCVCVCVWGWVCVSMCVSVSHASMHISRAYLCRRGYMISWRGGGERTFTSTPPPWTLPAWRHPPYRRGGWKNIHKHPHPPWTLLAWRHPPYENLTNTPASTFTSTPLGHCPTSSTSSTFQGGGGWSVPVTHTLHRFSGSGQVRGGGGDHPCHPPPLDPPLMWSHIYAATTIRNSIESIWITG